MNSIKAKAISDFEAGTISAREFGRILARITIRKGRKYRARTESRNERRYK